MARQGGMDEDCMCMIEVARTWCACGRGIRENECRCLASMIGMLSGRVTDRGEKIREGVRTRNEEWR